MNCSRFETLLSDYMDGMLDERVKAAVSQHVGSCPKCEALLKEVTHLREQLADFPEVAVPEAMVERILKQTTGLPKEQGFWQALVLPAFRPLLTQRYAFATLMMFVFLSFAVNVMGPGFSAFSYSRLSPSSLMNQADRMTEQVYAKWREFNDLKLRVGEEFRLFKEDMFGRLDYHLVTILFRSYSESIQEEQRDAETPTSDKENENEQ
ncbi:MAG: zf-HC2 domain-containing protein [Acidobacteriota bacterium]|nr:MAG: zf-HC2 domain-containing protein [Acidobacteriota bacterium]